MCTCHRRTLPESLTSHFLGLDRPDLLWLLPGDPEVGVKARERLRVLNSTELKFNLQRFIDGESALLFAQFIAASFFCVRCC